MTVVQQGSVNTTSLVVPDVVVQIVPPQQNYINGVPTNILGIVGTAQWGPVNSPTPIGSLPAYVAQFGNIQARKYDAGTAVWAATLNGANNFRIVRVTDGTDVAATAAIGTNGLTVTSKYTGTLGNIITVALATGTATGTWKAIVTLPGLTPEVFDNIGAGLAGNALWVAIAAAINSGTSARSQSQFIIASAGASTAAPTATTVTLSGGTDGASGVTSTQLIGTDGTTRTGMYALRSSASAVAMLADCDTSASWTTQIAFGLSEGTNMVMTGPAGDTISNAATVKASAGIDSYAGKLMFGDWVYFNDTVNGIPNRLISPQGFAAGRRAALGPHESTLNKPLYGIVGTQKSNSLTVYSGTDLQILAQAGIDVITNPSPGGNYFSCRMGRNCSSNAVINGDNYTGMTNYLAYSLNAAMGIYVGKLQDPLTRKGALGAVDAFLAGLWQQGMIGDASDAAKQPWSSICDNSNNPPARVALGYMQVDVRVTYKSVVAVLLINIEGGQSVSVNVVSVSAAS